MMYVFANVVACMLIFSACKDLSSFVYVSSGLLLLIISIHLNIKEKLYQAIEEAKKND